MKFKVGDTVKIYCKAHSEVWNSAGCMDKYIGGIFTVIEVWPDSNGGIKGCTLDTPDKYGWFFPKEALKLVDKQLEFKFMEG